MADNFGNGGLGTQAKRVFRKKESRAINESWVASVAMNEGTMVKFNASTGKVDPIAAVTDVPLGVLEVGARAAGDLCTVMTPFVAIVRGKADGAVAVGAKVAASGMDTANEKLTTYKTAVSTNYICGMALNAASSGGTDLYVGIYRNPALSPMP